MLYMSLFNYILLSLALSLKVQRIHQIYIDSHITVFFSPQPKGNFDVDFEESTIVYKLSGILSEHNTKVYLLSSSLRNEIDKACFFYLLAPQKIYHYGKTLSTPHNQTHRFNYMAMVLMYGNRFSLFREIFILFNFVFGILSKGNNST